MSQSLTLRKREAPLFVPKASAGNRRFTNAERQKNQSSNRDEEKTRLGLDGELVVLQYERQSLVRYAIATQQEPVWQQAGNNIFYNSGNVGIGTTSPQSKLHVVDGSLLLSGTTGGTPASGEGTRLMWIPAKGAFRAGYAWSNYWDDDSIGNYSTAMGRNVLTNGHAGSFIIGDHVGSLANNLDDQFMARFAGGYALFGGTDHPILALDPAKFSVAMGNMTSASAIYSTAMGNGTLASGENSTAMGFQTTTSGVKSTAKTAELETVKLELSDVKARLLRIESALTSSNTNAAVKLVSNNQP